MRKSITVSIVLLLLILIVGCGGSGSKDTTPPPTVSISISPTVQTVKLGATQEFAATVSGSSNTAVTWTVSGGGSISTSGLYAAPASATTPANVTVKATAQADTTKSASATVSIPAVSVVVSPNSASTILGATQKFTATVTNATDTAITWSAAIAGTVDATGLYKAPESLTTPASATITATPTADPSKAVALTVTIPAVSVSLNPSSATLTNGNAQLFAATVTNATDGAVTWKMSGKGSLDDKGQYRAPDTFANGDNATVTATSRADPTKSVSAAIGLEVFSRTVSGYFVMPDGEFKSLSVHFRDNLTGRLRPAGVHFTESAQYTNPAMVAIHPGSWRGAFVYTDAGLRAILGYLLNPDGSMESIPGSPFSAPSLRATAMYITPNGKFLYVGNSYGFMWGWAIDQDNGSLTPLNGSPWANGIDGNSIVADADTKHLYAMTAGNYQDSTIVVFDIDADTGVPAQVQSITAPGIGRSSGMGMDPSGKFLYATGFDLGMIDGFKIDATTGLLTFIPGSPFAGGGGPGEALVVDPLGKYVYAGNRFGIAMYTIDGTTGVLTEVAGSPFFAAFGECSDFHTDQTGNFLYTNVNHTSVALSVDRDNNRLNFLNSIHTRHTGGGTGRWMRFGLAASTFWDTLVPSFAYVLNSQDKTISTFSVDDTTGGLYQSGAAVPTGGVNPQAMAMDWWGKFLYVVNKDSNTLSGFKIDKGTGALTPIAGSPIATGPQPTGVAVETTGRALFVGTAGDDSLTQYTIDPTTGALTPAGSTPTGQCTGARSLRADWRGDYLYQVCAGTNKVASYELQIATGLLSSTSPHSTAAYGGASLALSPYGAAPPHEPEWHSFGFLVSQTDRQIKQFIVGNEGEMVYVSAGPVGPDQGIALDPQGKFAFAANSTGNSIQGVSIDPAEGTLTEISGSPWSTGVFPIAAAMDITGRYLYVVNRDSNSVSGYTVNTVTGGLTPMSIPTTLTGSKPVAILLSGHME